MTLQTSLQATSSSAGHAAQHNEVNQDVLNLIAGNIGKPAVILTGTPSSGQAPIATGTGAATWQTISLNGNIGTPLVTLSGTPSVGQVPVATGTNTATWQAVAGGGGGPGLTPTALKTANYTAAAGDLVLCNTTAGAFTVTTPVSPTNGQIFAVKLYQGIVGVTIAGTIDGASGYGMPSATGTAITLMYSSSVSSWIIY